MPILNGYDILKKISYLYEQEKYRNCKKPLIIKLSGDEDDLKSMGKYRFDHSLSKPPDFKVLKEIIAKINKNKM